MLCRSAGRLLALTSALALAALAGLTTAAVGGLALPAHAEGTGAASVQITGPDEFTAGEQDTVAIDVQPAPPAAEGVQVHLDVSFPHRLPPASVTATGFTCSVVPETDVECTGVAPSTEGTVQVTVDVAPGDEVTETIQAMLHFDDDPAIKAAKDVHITGTPSGLHMQIDAPDRLRPGDPITIRATAQTDYPVTGPVLITVNLISDRLSTVPASASAPGFGCMVRPRKDDDNGFSPSGADCTGDGLADSVTVTMTITVEPGHGAFGLIDATIRVGESTEEQVADIIVVGSDTTTVSGRVWDDLDRDGRQDPGEPGISGVGVVGPLSATTSGDNGRYVLADMDLGDSAVGFVAPSRFDFTDADVGDDQHDSDVTVVNRDCEDCVLGSLPLTLTGPTEHVDAGLFDPKVAPPTASPAPSQPGAPSTPAPRAGTLPNTLAFTGVPVARLTGIGILLLAVGAALLLVQRRRSSSPDRS